jgi:hypothetical protein
MEQSLPDGSTKQEISSRVMKYKGYLISKADQIARLNSAVLRSITLLRRHICPDFPGYLFYSIFKLKLCMNFSLVNATCPKNFI